MRVVKLSYQKLRNDYINTFFAAIVDIVCMYAPQNNL